ncbi:MAG: DUF2865 domain-containing protein [Hyphomicrobiales bacterium]|nr:DUF2865 domain-containing protein [Hyphomicrobiales bacterium]
MKEALGPRAAIGAVLGILMGFMPLGAAIAQQSPECMRLRQQIADTSRGEQDGQYQAAAVRQREELDRTIAYAHSIGCDRKQFLFFGSAPPPQCGEINAQIGRMRSNMAELQARVGGGRNELIARYNATCAAPQQPGNLLSALFGGGNNNVDSAPLNPDAAPIEEKPLDGNPGEARAGSKAVCVRSCDGSFFPVSYSAAAGKLQSLDDMCHALCPNADVSLYTYPASGEIEQAVSINGARYMDSPTALKYRHSYDSTCSCRARGQSWADALAGAEAKLGRESKGDIFVTPEKSAELSRPRIDPKAAKAAAKAAAAAAESATPNAGSADPAVDNLSQQAATISREGSGIAGGEAQTGARYSEGQGQTTEATGPDGVKRRVRIIDPAL